MVCWNASQLRSALPVGGKLMVCSAHDSYIEVLSSRITQFLSPCFTWVEHEQTQLCDGRNKKVGTLGIICSIFLHCFIKCIDNPDSNAAVVVLNPTTGSQQL